MSIPVSEIKKRRCSFCLEWKPLEQFYGKKYKQARCIPCYNAAYGIWYRRALREVRKAVAA